MTWRDAFLMRWNFVLFAFCCIFFLRDFPMRFHAFLLLWDCPYEICRVLLHIFSLWDVLVSFYAFGRTIFVRDILMRWHAFFRPWRVWRLRFHASFALMRFLDEITCFLAADISFWWCDVRTVERWMLKNTGDWVYTMVYSPSLGSHSIVIRALLLSFLAHRLWM